MMQLDQQSRWQSWMRMLAVNVQSVPESASLVGPTESPLHHDQLVLGLSHVRQRHRLITGHSEITEASFRSSPTR